MVPEVARFHYESADRAALMLAPRSTHPREWTAAVGVGLEVVSPDAVCLSGDNAVGRVRAMAVRLGHGMTLSYGHGEVGTGWYTSNRSQGQLILCALAAGCIYYDKPVQQRVVGGQCCASMATAGGVLGGYVPGLQHVSAVRIVVDTERLVADFRLPGGAARLRQAIGQLSVFDMDAATRRQVGEIIDLRPDRFGGVMRLEALTLQLVAAVVEQALGQSDPIDASETTTGTLRPREERQLRVARQILDLHSGKPPTVAELARQVGSNPSKLMRGFKARFGETVAECALRLRMERARRLLVEDRLAVSEVGFRVGYQHHSSFTAAFTDYYGATPSAVAADPALH